MNCINCDTIFLAKRNDAKFCPKCRQERTGAYWTQDFRWRLSKLLAAYKNRSKTKNLNHDIDLEYLVSLWEENEGRCALTGQEFNLESWGTGRVHPHTPSIDRITPSLGYTKGNIRLITYHMNMALSEFGTEEFEKMARAYLDYGVAA